MSKLKREIAAAFKNIPYPGDDNIIAHNVSYNSNYKLSVAFRQKKWQEITNDMIEYWRTDIARFTPEAFRYFFPAFLSRAYDKDSGELETCVISILCPSTDAETLERFYLRMGKFTEEQKKVIVKYIRHCFKDNPGFDDSFGQRVREYWGMSDKKG